MATEDTVLGFADLGGGTRGHAAMALHLLERPARRIMQFRLSGAGLKPQDLITYLRVHAARTRRRALAPRSIALDVVTPSGLRAVEISFGDV